MVKVGDPVATGFVINMARPTGNVTGVTSMTPHLTQKRLELLHDTVPKAERIAVITDPDDPISLPQWRDAQHAATHIGIHLDKLEIRNVDDLRKAFKAAASVRADACCDWPTRSMRNLGRNWFSWQRAIGCRSCSRRTSK